jgi:hypothetical protein
MALNLKYSALLKNAQQDAVTAQVAGACLINIYDGTQPASPDTAVSTQVLLAQLTGNATFAPAASSGVLTLNSITSDSSANATGTASWFRITTSGGTAKIDGTVGTSGCDLNLSSTSVTSGQTVAITSFTLTNGN